MFVRLRRALAPVLRVARVTGLAAARFHVTLLRAVPAVDTTVATAPATLSLWFNERPDPALSSLRLLGPDSALVTLGAVARADSMGLTAAVRGPLAPGAYTVLWRTAGPDGHVMRGRYAFRYQP